MAFTNTPFIDGNVITESDLKDRIDNFEKQLGYHDIRLSGQMDTLMVHRSRLEQIKIFLENMSQGYVSKE